MSVIEALVALAQVVAAGLGAKREHDQAKKDELQQAIDAAGKLPPPPKEK